MSSKICVVTGIGPGLGSAYVRRFVAGGYRVAMLGEPHQNWMIMFNRFQAATATPVMSQMQRLSKPHSNRSNLNWVHRQW